MNEELEQVMSCLGVDPHWLVGRQVTVLPLSGGAAERAEFLGVDCEGDDRPACCIRRRDSAQVQRVHYSRIRLIETPNPDAHPANEAEALGEDCNRLREVFLAHTQTTAFGPVSEQHFLLALSSLEQAERHAKIASMHYAAEVSAGVYGRRL